MKRELESSARGKILFFAFPTILSLLMVYTFLLASNMGFELEDQLLPLDNGNNIYFLSLPFFADYETIDDVLDDYYFPEAPEGVIIIGGRYICPDPGADTMTETSGEFLLLEGGGSGSGMSDAARHHYEAGRLPRKQGPGSLKRVPSLMSSPLAPGRNFEFRSLTVVDGETVRGGNVEEPFSLETGVGYQLQVICVEGCRDLSALIVGSHNPDFEGIEICPSPSFPYKTNYTIVSVPYHTTLQDMDELLLQILYSQGEPEPGLFLEAATYDAIEDRYKTRTVSVLTDQTLLWGGTEEEPPSYSPPEAYRIMLTCPEAGCPDPPLFFYSPHY